MTAFRLFLTIISAIAFIGCAANSDATYENCAYYQLRSFTISYFPESIHEKEPIMEIEEASDGVMMQVNWSQEQYQIADMNRYLRLKKQILTSSQWQKRVRESELLGFFTWDS